MGIGGGKTRNVLETIFRGKDEVSPVTKSLGGRLGQFAKKFGPVALAIGTAVAGLAAFNKAMRATIGFVKTSIELVPEQAVKVQGLSDALGIHTEKLQGMQFAASKAAVQNEALNLAVQRMTRRIGEAAKGAGEAQKEIKALGLEAAELADQAPDEQFLRVADALETVKGSSQRLASAFKFFDSEGARPVLQLMKQFPGTLREQIERAKELGGTYSKVLIKRSQEYTAANVELKTAIGAVREQIAERFLPIVTRFQERLTTWLVDNRTAIEETGKKLATEFEAGLKTVIAFIDEHGEQFGQLLTQWATIAGKTATLVIKVAEGTAEVIAFFSNENGKLDDYTKWLKDVNEAQEDGVNHAGNLMDTLSRGAEEWVRQKEEAERVKALTEAIAGLAGPGVVPRVELGEAAKELRDLSGQEYKSRVQLGIDREFGEPFPEEEPDTGLPSLEEMDLVTAKFGDLEEAAEQWGTATVEQTLRLNGALQSVGSTATSVLVDGIGQGVATMTAGLSRALVANFRNIKNFGDAAKQMWRSFTDSVLAMLVQLIAKLLVAAVLQSVLGFGNFRAVGNLTKILGIARAVPGGQFGGVVPGGSAGDRVLMALEPKEGVVNRRGMQRLGQSGLARLNQGHAPVPPGDFAGAPMVMSFHIQTILGNREEGFAVARGVFDLMSELALVPAVYEGA